MMPASCGVISPVTSRSFSAWNFETATTVLVVTSPFVLPGSYPRVMRSSWTIFASSSAHSGPGSDMAAARSTSASFLSMLNPS